MLVSPRSTRRTNPSTTRASSSSDPDAAATADADGTVSLPGAAAPVSIAIGLALLTATLWLARGLGWVYGHVVQAIQVARPQPVRPRHA